MRETISIKLFNTLKKGKGQLAKEALERIIHFVGSQKTEEGAFVNKNGKADLYYTSFGLMLSYVLGISPDNKKTGIYLKNQNVEELDLVHYAAYMRCRIISQLQKNGKIGLFLESLSPANIFAANIFPTNIKELQVFSGLPHDDPQSPYTRFIWLSLLEDTGHKVNDKQAVLDSMAQYRAKYGGYSNIQSCTVATEATIAAADTTGAIANTRIAATNATVAALAVTGQLKGYKDNRDILYLRDLQKTSGGFAAAENSPVPDMLSTATSLFMLSCYGTLPKYPARDFIEAHWLDSGGFSATLADEQSDVEYTFYGLLALGAIEASGKLETPRE